MLDCFILHLRQTADFAKLYHKILAIELATPFGDPLNEFFGLPLGEPFGLTDGAPAIRTLYTLK